MSTIRIKFQQHLRTKTNPEMYNRSWRSYISGSLGQVSKKVLVSCILWKLRPLYHPVNL
jgi:hypothetical protein